MAIHIENLTKSYKKNIVLNQLNLHIKEGSIFGLLGPNGAGKTTLISMLNYLEPYEKGNIKILGKEHKNNRAFIQGLTSFVPQEYAFYKDLTAYENLEFFAALYQIKSNAIEYNINEALKMTALKKYQHQKAKNFSGGLKRRLNIAIGLLNNPKILYLDEPTVGIDPQSRQYILDIIKHINQTFNTTIIYTSHYMEEIEYICDEVAVLDQQHILKQAKIQDLKKERNPVKIHLHDTILTIEASQNYEKLTQTLQALKTQEKTILNIEFGNNNLEKMFFDLTKKDLRD